MVVGGWEARKRHLPGGENSAVTGNCSPASGVYVQPKRVVTRRLQSAYNLCRQRSKTPVSGGGSAGHSLSRHASNGPSQTHRTTTPCPQTAARASLAG